MNKSTKFNVNVNILHISDFIFCRKVDFIDVHRCLSSLGFIFVEIGLRIGVIFSKIVSWFDISILFKEMFCWSKNVSEAVKVINWESPVDKPLHPIDHIPVGIIVITDAGDEIVDERNDCEEDSISYCRYRQSIFLQLNNNFSVFSIVRYKWSWSKFNILSTIF